MVAKRASQTPKPRGRPPASGGRHGGRHGGRGAPEFVSDADTEEVCCVGYEDAQMDRQENAPTAEMFDSQRDLDKAETVEEYAEVYGGPEVEYI